MEYNDKSKSKENFNKMSIFKKNEKFFKKNTKRINEHIDIFLSGNYENDVWGSIMFELDRRRIQTEYSMFEFMTSVIDVINAVGCEKIQYKEIKKELNIKMGCVDKKIIAYKTKSD